MSSNGTQLALSNRRISYNTMKPRTRYFKPRNLFRPLGCLALFVPFLAAALDYGIMPLNNVRLQQWQADLVAMPVYQTPAGYANAPGSVNLLGHLHYEPRTRNQGHTGTCWLWGCTAVMSIDFDVQHGGTPALTNGLSVQFAASNLGFVNTSLQEGGNPNTVKRFYEAVGFGVPWSNTNADWTDGSGWNKTTSGWRRKMTVWPAPSTACSVTRNISRTGFGRNSISSRRTSLSSSSRRTNREPRLI